MTVTSIIVGRTPRIAVRLAFGQGRRTPATGRTIAVVGGKSATGTGVVNVVTSLASADEAVTHFGPGTGAALAVAGIFAVDARAKVRGIVAGDSTATVATKDTVLTVPPTLAGTFSFQIGDCILPVSHAALETLDNIGAAIVAAYAAHPESPCVITYAAGTDTITLTSKDKGTQCPGIKWRVYNVQAGLTFTPSSGTLDTGGGANELDWSAAYAALSASGEQIDLIIPCTNTTAAFTVATTGLRDRIVAAAQPGVEKWWSVVIGQNGSVATATTQADSFDLGTVNPATEPGWWFQIICAKNNYGLPWVIAARCAAARAGDTATNPNKRWCDIQSGRVIPGITLPITDADYITDAEIETCLSNGVTPIRHDKAAVASYLVWPITTKHVTGGAADYRSSDTGIVDTTVWASRFIKTSFADQDWEYVSADNTDGTVPDNLAAQTVTPSMAASFYCGVYKGPTLSKYLDPTYVDDVGVTHDIDDLVEFSIGAGTLDGLGPLLVKRWLRAIGLDLREYGTG